MKTYILKLKQKSGLLTDLQSDTIYGHFCWRLKEKFGVNALDKFLDLYKNQKPVFLLSDGLLEVNNDIYFPLPLIFENLETKTNKFEKVLDFVDRKRKKERTYLTLSELNHFLSTGEIKLNELNSGSSDHRKHKKQKSTKRIIEESLRVSVQIDRISFSSAEGKLFSYKPKFSRHDVFYVVLIKVLDENNYSEFHCEEILEETFIIGFGKKKSSGYGQFDVVDYSEFSSIQEASGSNYFLVLGNYLPSNDDMISPINYDINIKYGRFGEELALSANPFKNPIVFLTAGSCFKTKNKKDFYGRITTQGEISAVNDFAVQFGIPFILHFND